MNQRTRRLLWSLILVFFSGTMALGASSLSKHPNVLFIAIDDLNDWIGCLGGHPQARTPNLDRLAQRGTLFTNTHCAAPACGPSRAALMTGIRPWTSGNYRNAQSFTKNEVLSRAVTLPQCFRNNGYYAQGAGKIFHGAHYTELQGRGGWDNYWPSMKKHPGGPSGVSPAKSKLPLNKIPKTNHFDWGPLDFSVQFDDMSDAKIARWAGEQLQRRYDKPFLLTIGIFRPHLPWFAPQKYFDLFPLEEVQLPIVKQDDLSDVPTFARTIGQHRDHAVVTKHQQWRRAVQAYLACSTFTDDCVGIVLDALDRSPHKNNTIVVLWADHGWHLGEKLHWRKFTLWEEATRCPMMWVVPGVTQPGSRCDAPVNLIDIYPTLVSLCGLDRSDGLKQQLAGYDLSPLLNNANAAWPHPTVTSFGFGNHSVRSQRWRYTRYHDGTEELYDHVSDPREWTNLINNPQHRDITQRLAHALPKHETPTGPNTKRSKK